ncbi:hypothetical protein [Moorena producens]|uniref:hypothetical protein n=1 Tax=Moorena producens TaxID=1155739 RepID=UPI001930EE93|nr:hypothetical protein [Moorena producens]
MQSLMGRGCVRNLRPHLVSPVETNGSRSWGEPPRPRCLPKTAPVVAHGGNPQDRATSLHRYRSQPLISPRQTLPTMYDLPSENPKEPGLPDEFHFLMQSLMGGTPKTAPVVAHGGNPQDRATSLHRFFQPLLLLLTFAPANSDPELVFSASDLNLYYDLNHPGWYKRPYWFGVVGVPRLYESKDLRLSYVIWQEQVSPFLMQSLMGVPPKTAPVVAHGGNPQDRATSLHRFSRYPPIMVTLDDP